MRCDLCVGAAVVWSSGAAPSICPACGGTGEYNFISLRDPALWLRGATLVPERQLDDLLFGRMVGPAVESAVASRSSGPVSRASREHASQRAAVAAFFARPRCAERCPRDWTGHWREFHRGHGCDLDPTPDPELPSPRAS